MKKADTIEALAKEINVPAETLKATLETWNKAVADKNDAEFGRKNCNGPWFIKRTILRNPNRTWYSPYNGWIEDQHENRVLKEDGSVIKAYTQPVKLQVEFTVQTVSVVTLFTDIIIFGRQAGAQSAAYAKEN